MSTRLSAGIAHPTRTRGSCGGSSPKIVRRVEVLEADRKFKVSDAILVAFRVSLGKGPRVWNRGCTSTLLELLRRLVVHDAFCGFAGCLRVPADGSGCEVPPWNGIEMFFHSAVS